MTYAETRISENRESYTVIILEPGPKPPPEVKVRGRKPGLKSPRLKDVTEPRNKKVYVVDGRIYLNQ